MKKPSLIFISLAAFLVISCAVLSGLDSKVQETEMPSPTLDIQPDAGEQQEPFLVETNAVETPVNEPDRTEAANQGKIRSLYFLIDDSIWRVEEGQSDPVRFTPQDTLVTAFDVWSVDGRIAFAARDGRLFSILPGGQLEQLVQIGSHPSYPAYIGELNWSPDGENLAYTVHLDSQGQGVYADFPTPPTGLWIINIFDRDAVWLKSSHYLSSAQGNIKQIRVLARPRWSPDGTAIMLTDGYYEWTNIDWIDPLQPTEDDSNFHPMPKNPEGNLQSFMYGVWMPDGKSLVVSGELYSQFSSLVRVDRESGEAKPLIDGKTAGIYIFDASPVPESSYLPGGLAGIHSGPNRFVFLANCATCGDASPARLYGATLVDGSLRSQVIGPEKMCSGMDSYGNANDARIIEWAPDFTRGVLICGSNEMYILEFSTESFTLTDLIPYLPPHPENEVPIFKWGE